MSADQRELALYIRVSTEEQATDGNSLYEQEEQLSAFADKHGYEAYRVYKDEGFSAKSLQRPAIQALLCDVRQGRISGVVTTRIDRLTRRVSDFAKLVDELNHYGVFYRSTRQNFEIGTAMGRLMVVILSAIAEFEREMISERVFENLHSMVRRGMLATKPPFGYRVVDGRLVVDEEESIWLQRAAALLEGGNGARVVAKFLNDQGVRSKHGRLWSDRSVRTLFQNPVLIGTLTWNRRRGAGRDRRERDPSDWIVIPQHHPAVLSEEVFQRINATISRRASFAAHARHGARLLSGIAHCGFCGAPMHAGWQIYDRRDGRQRRKTYRCGRYASGGGCVINRVDAAELDTFVMGQLVGYAAGQPDATALVDWKTTAKKHTDQEVIELKRALRQVGERLERLMDALGLGVISTSEFAEAKAKLTLEQAAAEQRLDLLATSVAFTDTEADREMYLSSAIVELITDLHHDHQRQRAVVLELLESVRVYRPDWRTEPEVEIVYRL